MAAVVTDRRAYLAAARGAPAGVRIPVEVRAEVADPFEAYRRARNGPGGFFLETSGGQPGWGYFGVSPVARLGVTAAEAADAQSLSALASFLADERLVRAGCDVPYPGGVVGWLSYEIARELESLSGTTTDDRGLPRLQLGRYERLAAWRNRTGGETTLRVIAAPRVGDDPRASYEAARAGALELASAARTGNPTVGPPPARAPRATFESECGRTAFSDRVDRIKGYIRAGDTFQTNVSHRLVAPAAVHPVEVFAALRRVNPAPYSALLEFPGVDLVGASPELLVRRVGSRLCTEPIAGTRPRGATADEDRALEQELRNDEKERAEHAMLVDLARNDLGRVATHGSVAVEEYRRVDRYASVMHLVSRVEGRLDPAHGLAEVVAAMFPGGTVTGAPKPRTMEIIDEVEERDRGPYTGSVGLFGFDGRATLNIVIRTLVRTGTEYGLRVGAGIVHDSEPDREYDETLAKARGLIDAVDGALGGRANLAVAEHPGGLP